METKNSILNKKHIHFIGIGGSGIFPIVEILNKKGYYITGSDNNESDIVRSERKMGIQVFMPQSKNNIKDADLIIYSAAIAEDNEELIAAKSSGVKTLKRSEILGEISDLYKNSICISGTHGKTTTTSMLTQVLIDANLDPSAVIGGKLKSVEHYGISGSSENFVCEACEFSDTFLELNSSVSVILNIDNDHMDYFKTMDNLKNSFFKFASNATNTLIYNGDDQNSVDVANKVLDVNKISFGLLKTNDYYATEIKNLNGMQTEFFAVSKDGQKVKVTLYVPGKHNVLNCLAAIAAAGTLGVKIKDTVIGIKNFKGAGRRFEYIGEVNGVTVIDDYAHHPAEIEAVLKAAKGLNFKTVWALFQPFTYSRTKSLLKEFARALSLADKTVITEIMGGREKNTCNIYKEDLQKLIKGAVCVTNLDDAARYVLNNANEGDLVLTLGCGDVYKAAKIMVFGKY